MTASTELTVSVLLVVGPTAVGKTELSLALALELGAEIVSLDSRQIYRGMDIGTAKPSPEERRLVPHHLLDVADPDAVVTLADIQVAAYAAIRAAHARGRPALLVGGTGQYARAVAEGWRIPPVTPDPEYRAELEALAARAGPGALFARLERLDPVSAERIDRRNVRRVVRALEVCRATGRPFSAMRSRRAPPYPILWLGLTRPREELYARIDRRVEDMLERGLEGEVRGLVGAGYGFDLPAMTGLGYGEWREYFGGAVDVAEVARRIRRNTRRLVRSQSTWFRADDPRIRWFQASTTSAADAVAWLARHRAG